MTERWRKKLEGIDGASPNDDVFERAKEGPMHGDAALPGPRMSTRVVTIVASFLVFALAISVFAIPALRMGNQAGSQVTGLLPLWPAQTPDQLAQLQADPPAWALDPQQVAERFGQQVMGWPESWAGDLACDMPAFVSSSPSGTLGFDPTGGNAICDANVIWGGYGPSFSSAYAIPASTASPTQDSAFRNYSVFPCNVTDTSACDLVIGGPEFVQIYQPLEQGEGQIWAVLQARSERIQLSVAAGQNVRDGASVSAGYYSSDGTPTLAYASCGLSGASSSFRTPDQLPTRLSLVMGNGISLDVSLPESEVCSGPQPGYVWAATSNASLAAADGTIASDPVQQAGLYLSGLTAAPVTMVFPQVGAQTTAATSPTPEQTDPATPSIEPGSWTTYDGGLGFTMELPADWGRTGITDEIVVNAPSGEPYIQINRVDDPPKDDSSFPLNFADYQGDNQPHFYGDGQTFIIQWLTGTPDPLTPEQSAVVERIVESIRFEPWNVGDERQRWTAVGEILPASSAQWITFKGEHYIASYVGSTRTLFGPAPKCASGDGTYEVRETGDAGISCPDGTGGDWDFATGLPRKNSQAFAVGLDPYPAVRSWDGMLLVQPAPQTGVTIGATRG